MPYHAISQNVKSEHTFTIDLVPFQRLEPSEIDAVLNPSRLPRPLTRLLLTPTPWESANQMETVLKVEENNEPADDTRLNVQIFIEKV